MGVHVLTIGSETFISDLRIRPIKQQLSMLNEDTNPNGNNNGSSSVVNTLTESSISSLSSTGDDYKLTWNLEIRRLRKDDSAFYYCVLNSENAYGQIYRLNVLCKEVFLFLEIRFLIFFLNSNLYLKLICAS